MNSNKFLELINGYETIAVFRHVNPDGDALGSQWAMVNWLKLNFPNKKIVALGMNNHTFSKELFPAMDTVDNLENFLSIVVDTANRPRIDDSRYQDGDAIIKIDHHPEVDPYGDLQIVDSSRGSVCEIIADLFNACNLTIDSNVSQCLLAGIMTDTQKFTIESTSYKTLESAAWLMRQGANITYINYLLYTRTRKDFELTRDVQNHIESLDNFAFIKFDRQLLDTLSINEDRAKLFTGTMAGIEEFKIWGLFIEEEDGLYSASLRSRNETINTIAEAYGGGGHRLACGIKGLTTETLEEVIGLLRKASLK